MDLKLLFEPIAEELVSQNRKRNGFLSSISTNKTGFIDYRGYDIALVGLGDYRGDGGEASDFGAVNNVRNKLYSFSKGIQSYKVIDLGNMRSGPSLEDSYQRVQEVCHFLMENEIVPVLIGGAHDLNMGQFMGYEDADKLVSVLNVDAHLDMDDEGNESNKHIQKMFLHEPNYLFNYNHLAYQSYLVDQEYLNVLEKLYFTAVRLGELRVDFKEVEPAIRDADMLSFDIGAIKKAYCPGSAKGEVFGLTGEEACQITWYAGQNDKLSSAGFYGYDVNKEDEHMSTAMVMATMVWYFVEGYYERKGEKIFRSNDFVNYTVAMGGNPDQIVFFKSKKSEKWWMEVPGAEEHGIYHRSAIVPCSYSDYETATQGEIPDRWMHRLTKSI